MVDRAHAARRKIGRGGRLGNLTLINRHDTYAHNDPNGAYPQNDFIDGLIPFLQGIRQ